MGMQAPRKKTKTKKKRINIILHNVDAKTFRHQTRRTFSINTRNLQGKHTTQTLSLFHDQLRSSQRTRARDRSNIRSGIGQRRGCHIHQAHHRARFTTTSAGRTSSTAGSRSASCTATAAFMGRRRSSAISVRGALITLIGLLSSSWPARGASS